MKRKAADEATKLELVGKLGSGVYGDVFETKIYGSRQYASKFLLQEKGYDFYMPANMREILLGGTCCSLRKGVVTFTSGNVHASRTYATISDSGFCNLSQLSKKPIPLDAALYIAKAILEQLRDIHAKGIMHRDIKPDNIMIMTNTWPLTLKIIDFGLSTCQLKSKESPVVSLWWRAPEILYDLPHDQKTDIWSVGILLSTFMCYRSVTWGSQSEEETIKNIWTKIGFPTKESFPDLHESLGEFMFQIFAKEYENPIGIELLYPDASDILAGCLNPNPEFRLSAQELLDLPQFKSINEDKVKHWFLNQVEQVHLYKDDEEIVVYDEHTHFNFCYEFGNSVDLYEHKIYLSNIKSYHLNFLKIFEEKLRWDPIVLKECIILLDKVIALSEPCAIMDQQVALLSAITYIGCVVFTDYFPSLQKLMDISGCSSTVIIKHAVHHCMCVLKCSLISKKIRLEIMENWDSLLGC